MAKIHVVQERKLFWCPGCDCGHFFDGRWEWNGSVEKPTFSPSLSVSGYDEKEKRDYRCHSFVRDGRIEFLGDTTHSLAGKTVEIPEWEET